MLDEVFNVIGVGKIEKTKRRLRYSGTFPDDAKIGEPVCMIRRSDLEKVFSTGQLQLMQTRIAMPVHVFKSFPDVVVLTDGAKLFLDRHFYSFYPLDYHWLRYESVDEAFVEGEI